METPPSTFPSRSSHWDSMPSLNLVRDEEGVPIPADADDYNDSSDEDGVLALSSPFPLTQAGTTRGL